MALRKRNGAGRVRDEAAFLYYPASLCLFAADDYAKRAVQVNTLLYAQADAAGLSGRRTTPMGGP